VSVARQLGSGNSFARLLCCPAQAERGGKRRTGSTKLTMSHPRMPERLENARFQRAHRQAVSIRRLQRAPVKPKFRLDCVHAERPPGSPRGRDRVRNRGDERPDIRGINPIPLHHLADDTRSEQFFETGMPLGEQRQLGWRGLLGPFATASRYSMPFMPHVCLPRSRSSMTIDIRVEHK